MEHTVKQRIIKFIKYKGIGQTKFERAVGLSNGYLNQLRHAPSYEKIQMFSLSLGATWPNELPSTLLGTMVSPARAVAPVCRNFLLDILLLMIVN